jgi:uncharacterized protein (DUF927 family)
METSAEAASDGFFVLDEIGQADPGRVTKAIYLIANETGKDRMSDKAMARSRRSWRTFVMSTGEHDIAAIAAQAGQKVPAGVEVRLPSIPTKAENTWTNLHGYGDTRAFWPVLISALRQNYGTAARAFIERLVQERAQAPDELVGCLKAMRERFFDALPADADPQVNEVARRFALVACAGELATEWGVLSWKEGDAQRAAIAMFKRWLEARGGAGSGEEAHRVESIRRFLLSEGARFLSLVKSGKRWIEDPGRLPIQKQAGWRQRHGGDMEDGRSTYLIHQDVWREECLRLGLDPVETARTIHKRGHLTPGEGNNLAKMARVPSVSRPMRFYHIEDSLLSSEGEGET